MAKISVITPLHAAGNRYIQAAWETLQAQTLQDFEWIVLENRGGKLNLEDPRISISHSELEGVGALKRRCCELASSPFIVELDNDDLLEPTALEKVLKTFEEGAGADFVYSDFAEFRDDGDGGWTPAWQVEGGGGYPYSSEFGWQMYPVVFQGRALMAMRAPEATAHNIRWVDHAPNHVRAWRKEFYDLVGGHDPKLQVADDHDLVVRLFLAGARFSKIPECLYFYRVHRDNTVTKKNAEIRNSTEKVYNKSIFALAEKWTRDQKLRCVDLCGGFDSPPGYVVLDQVIPESVPGIQGDLNKRWQLPDSSVGVIRAYDALEHLKNPVHTMNEAWRVLAPGGFFLSRTPSTSGMGAFCDPTHLSFWNELSFRYYCNQRFSRYIREFKGRFQASRVFEWCPSGDPKLPYVEADLFCVKDGFRAMGPWGWG